MNTAQTLLSILIKPIQRVENTLIDILLKRSIDTAEGVWLAVLGDIVGQPNYGWTDDVYRRYIRARVAVNRSTGRREDLIRITRLVIGEATAGQIYIHTIYNATFMLEIRDVVVTADVAKVLQTMLAAAVAQGVRIVVVYGQQTLANTFRLDSGPGLDQGHLARGIDPGGTP